MRMESEQDYRGPCLDIVKDLNYILTVLLVRVLQRNRLNRVDIYMPK